MKAIKFNRVTKKFGDVTAVHDSNLTVEQGQIFGFLGPNGAGKTTSIRCLMDFIHPNAGSIEVLGLDSQQDSVELKSKIGYLSADSHLYQDWTGKQHIQFVEQMRGSGDGAEKLIKQLSFDENAKVRTLSTGNKQKLAIILAYIGDPKLIIMDEPTQGLDPILQNQFYELISAYRKAGGTIFMSSHNLSEVEKLCDSVVIINKGKIVKEESLAGIKAKASHYVYVRFDNPDADKIPDITGAKIIRRTPDSIDFKTDKNLNGIINEINKYPIKDLDVARSNLDAIFMEYYD